MELSMNNNAKRCLVIVLSMILLFAACHAGEQVSDTDSFSSKTPNTVNTSVNSGISTSTFYMDESTASSGSTGGSSGIDVSTSRSVTGTGINTNRGTADFRQFSNTIDYTGGGKSKKGEDYLDYKKYAAGRHEFKDMIGHESEVAAVRLTDMGVFPKTTNFGPSGSVTVVNFIRYLFAAANITKGSATDSQLIKLAESNKLIEKGIIGDYNINITNEQLAYIIDRAVADRDNVSQYSMMIKDLSSIDSRLKQGVLQVVGLGIIECSNGLFQPKAAAKKSVVADALYRLVNTGARVITPYDLGELYKDNKNSYLVKSSYKQNPGGIQLGFYSNYNFQDMTFTTFGKRAVDRVEFYKWTAMETSKGNYNFKTFGNDLAAHKMGNTVISTIDISANTTWNSQFGASNIPSFYPQDITNSITRAAAKKFLYAFVQSMLKAVHGDYILAIDYELDWQQALWNTEAGIRRAKLFTEWYEEACSVARDAARDIGASDRLNIIVIYNNITSLHLRGANKNSWMLRLAAASDYVGIDSYQFYDDKTDPSYTLQNIRFLINNYSLKKPVIMCENGLDGIKNQTDSVTGLSSLQVQANYYRNLFREFRFALEKGDFLNKDLSGYLVWELKDKNITSGKGIKDYKGGDKPAVLTVKEGIKSIEKQKQFNPSILNSVRDATSGADIAVNSGAAYDKLTYITRNHPSSNGGSLNIRLKKPGTVFITVNGEVHYVSKTMSSSHSIYISKGLESGFNVIDIYFGSEKTPFTQRVESVSLI
ncbi:MAG: hypothetical protein PHR24_00280 [Oscillospiraceae bacterium]|nr:hypothetical protein [Oscillospiraceae bacterium]